MEIYVFWIIYVGKTVLKVSHVFVPKGFFYEIRYLLWRKTVLDYVQTFQKKVCASISDLTGCDLANYDRLARLRFLDYSFSKTCWITWLEALVVILQCCNLYCRLLYYVKNGIHDFIRTFTLLVKCSPIKWSWRTS